MTQLKPPTALERISGNVATESALTVVAALVGGPLAPLLPVLAKSLASERQKARLELAFMDINAALEEHGEQIRDLSDEQYKIINEAVLALLQTTQMGKLHYLRATVKNALKMDAMHPQEAIVLSRIVRDISAEEAEFVIKNFGYKYIRLPPTSDGVKAPLNVLQIAPESPETLIVAGLLSLGLLVPGASNWDGPNDLIFTRIVAKLIALLRTS